MPKMRDSDLKAILAAEKADALASVTASKLTEDRTKATDYYMGDMRGDMPSLVGRSSAVSSDVADTVEGLMPSLMEIFANNEEVVQFNPVGKEDVAAAEQETDYVNHVFMQKNPGFVVLYSMIKDALLSKVGIVKVFWEKDEQEDRETYLDQSDDAFMALVSNPEIEVVEHTHHEDTQTHDVTVQSKRDYSCAKVVPVPPEEFGISRRARSIKDANYCFHEVQRTHSELIDDGFDESQVKTLPSYSTEGSTEEVARDTVAESTTSDGDEGLNEVNRPIKITEHYVRLDYRGDGKAGLYRITTAGDQGEILKRNGERDIVQVDMIPFAAMTPVPITHRFFGRSIADLVMDIQRIKTALMRALLDNAYLINNTRTEIAESHAGENTLDDLLVSRPGGIVRTKQPGGLFPLATQPIGQHVLPLIEYVDATREWRTGVTRQGQGIDADALQNQSATAVNQAFTAAQARMRLIARIFAETGIRDLFALLHATIRKNGSKADTVKLRNQWVTVNPRDWKQRNDITIQVGLGSGNKSEKVAHVMALIGLQKEALLAGKTNLVDDAKLFNSAKELAKLLEYKDPEKFFNDPMAVNEQGQPKYPAPPPQPDPKLLELQVKSQMDQQALQAKAEIEKLQAQADIATQDRKTQAEITLADRKFQLERELKMIDAQMKMTEHQQTMQLKSADYENKAQERAAKAEAGPKASIEVKHGAEEIAGPLAEVVGQLGQHLATSQAAQMQALMAAVERSNAPKRIVRDPKTGRVSHVEPMH